MWKFIFLLVAIYIVYKLFAGDILKKRQKMEKEEQEEIERKTAAGEMVQDPVCGTYVSLDDSISVKKGGQTWHFCSYDCRDKFLKRLDGRDSAAGQGEN